MNERPWTEPNAGSRFVFALLFWIGAITVAVIMFSPNLYGSFSSRGVVYLAGAGVLSLTAAVLLTQPLLRGRRSAAKANTSKKQETSR